MDTQNPLPVPPISVLAGSASFQSHLSSLNTQQRLRPAAHHGAHALGDAAAGKDLWLGPADALQPRSRALVLATFVREHLSLAALGSEAPAARHHAFSRSARGLFYVYCLVSAVFFSTVLCGRGFSSGDSEPSGRSPSISAPLPADGPWTSDLDALPVDTRLAKLFALHLPPKAFEPAVLRPSVDSASIAAALWARDDGAELDALAAWAEAWQGPISLLVVTHDSPPALRRRMFRLLDGNKLLNDTLTLHVLHVHRAAEDTPNAFLNIARLFSPTATVLLFPASLSVAPPASSSALLPGPGPGPDSAPPSDARPVLLSPAAPGAPAPAYPFAALTPVLVARAHAFWCTERLFLGPSRASDWDECLWQLWLDALGDVAVLAAPAWRAPPEAPTPAPHPITATMKRRLSGRYRSESCVLAAKRIEALGAGDGKRLGWLRRVCREWHGGSLQ